MNRLKIISWIAGAGMLAGGCSHSKTMTVGPGDPAETAEGGSGTQSEDMSEGASGKEQPFENVMNNPLQDEQWMLKPTGSGNDYQWVAVKKTKSESGQSKNIGGRNSGMMVEGVTLQDGERTGPVYVKTVKQLMAEASNPRDPVVRMDAISALAKAQFGGEEQYMKLYRAALAHDPDMGVRVAAVRAIGQHGSGNDLSTVDSLSRNANSIMRAAAGRAADQIRTRTGQ